MNMKERVRNIPSWVYALSIVLVTVAYGASYIVLKEAINAVDTAWLLTIRFFLATLIMGVVFHKRIAQNLDGSHLLAGVIVGVPEALGFLFQNIGIKTITPGRNAFLTATYCVMVPFLAWIFEHRKPTFSSILAGFLCLFGVGLFSLTGENVFSLGMGDWLTLLGALFFGLNIVAVEMVGSAHDSVTMTFVMFGVAALVNLAWATAFTPLPSVSAFTPDFFAQLAYITVFCTVLGLLTQNVAQRHLPSAEVALLFSLESLFGELFSVALYGEEVTFSLVAGSALIFISVLVSQLGPVLSARRHAA